MKNVDTGLIRTVSLALMVAMVIALAFVGPVAAEPLGPDIPTFPNFFYGTVRTDQGIVLPGQQVVALAVTGGWTGNSTAFTDPASRYGYDPQFFVPGVDSGVPGSGAVNGDQIAFFVQGVRAFLYDVATGTTSLTYSFVSGGDTELNLIVPLRYTITATAGPNGSIAPQGAVTVNYGFNQTFTFTPNPNYQILDVLVDGVSNPGAVTAGSYTFTNVTANHTIHVTFVKSTYLITPTAGPGCTITPGTPQTVPYRGSRVFNITANTGYSLLDVLVDGASQGPIPSYVFTNVTADHTIIATCERKDFVITPFWGSGGAITPGTPQTVPYGGSVTFSIVPNAGYVVDNVVVNGVSQGAITSYTFTNVTANGTIAATFKVADFVIVPTAGADGTITPGTPQIIGFGGSATFTIVPNTGYVIDDVRVDGVSQGAIASYTFSNVTANHTIQATFKVATFVITPTAGAGGTITPNTPQTVNYGASAAFTITPNTGYVIDDVRVDGVSQGAMRQLHLQQRHGQPHHRGYVQGGDLRDHADCGCEWHDHAEHAADRQLRRQRHLHHCAEHRLRHRRCAGGRRVARRYAPATPSATSRPTTPSRLRSRWPPS